MHKGAQRAKRPRAVDKQTESRAYRKDRDDEHPRHPRGDERKPSYAVEMRIASWSRLGLLGSFALSLVLVHCVGDEPQGSATDSGLDVGSVDAAPPPDSAPPEAGLDASVQVLEDAVSVSAGRAHTCVVTAAQDVLCWGANGVGQLGVPTAQVARSSVPVKVELGAKATSVAAGGNHSCAILTDGSLRCWGSNERGQLGRGTLVATGGVGPVTPPTKNAAAWTTAEVITAGASFTCVGMRAGDLGGIPGRRFFCWGENIARQVGTESTNGQPALVPNMITQNGTETAPAVEGYSVSCGDDFACAGYYAAAGAAFFTAIGCWGSRTNGQIGGPPINGYEVGIRYPSSASDGGQSPIIGLFKEGLVATGAGHGCVRVEQAGVTPVALRCWGNNTKGQTGSALVGYRPAEAVAGFDATNVSALGAGGANTCVIVNGQVQCIGANEVGQLGRGAIDARANATFANVGLPPSASSISVGATHACAVLGAAPGQKGQVACWGNNQSGQLGDGLDIDAGYPGAPEDLKRVRPSPVRVRAAR